MSTASSSAAPSNSDPLPPSRFILDLDQPLQLQALLEMLDLLKEPPLPLEKQAELRQWRAQVWLRASYLLMHCSLTRSGNSHADLSRLATSHNFLATQLKLQDNSLARHSGLPRV